MRLVQLDQQNATIRMETMMKSTRIALALLAALSVSPVAMAERTGFYIGADLGSTSVDIDKGNLDSLFAIVSENELEDFSSSLDDSDSSWDIVVGYRLMPYLAAEVAYVDLGGAEYKATSIFDESADISTESSGFAASLMGILPFAENFEAFARLGVYFGDTEVGGSFTDYFGDTYTGDDSKSEQEMFWGVGAGYNFGERWGVRAEYTQFMDIGEDDLTAGEADVARVSVGITYGFN